MILFCLIVQPPLMLMGESPVVIFTPDGPNTTTISVSTADDAVGGQGERSVILRLEYDGSPEFRQFVRIGGENTSEQIEIIIVDNDRKFVYFVYGRLNIRNQKFM